MSDQAKQSLRRRTRKEKTIVEMYNALGNHKQIIVLSLVNIDANQVNEIRKYLRRGRLGSLVIGKKTVIRKALRMRARGLSAELSAEDRAAPAFATLKEHVLPEVASLESVLRGKLAFIFTDMNAAELKKAITKTPIPREAKVGAVAPCDVLIKEGPTGLPPSEVNFFHALGLHVKINKGILDLQKEVALIKKGQRVGNSEASLLKKLGLKPFTYALEFLHVYDEGHVFPASIFEITAEEVAAKVQAHVKSMAALSIEAGLVNSLSAPLMVAQSFKNMLAMALEAGYEMDALAAATSAQAGAPAPAGKAADTPAPKKEEKPAEPEPPVDELEGGLGGLFDF